MFNVQIVNLYTRKQREKLKMDEKTGKECPNCRNKEFYIKSYTSHIKLPFTCKSCCSKYKYSELK